MEKKKVIIKASAYNVDDTVIPDGYFDVVFYNQGTSNVLLMNTILLEPGDSHEFNMWPDVVINSKMDFHFIPGTDTTTALTNSLCVTRIYCK